MLLKFYEQNNIKPISENNESKYPLLAREVEEGKLKELIGIELLQDLQVNPNTDDNKNLLNGCSFVNRNGNTVKHQGLKYVIAYMNYSKYIGESFVNDTFTGMVRKTRQDAENLTSGDISRLQGEAQSIALTEFEIIKDFLVLNYSKYPLFKKCHLKDIYTPKFRTIRKTVR